jgi:hypothetical protein
VAVKNTEINKILFNCFWQLEIFLVKYFRQPITVENRLLSVARVNGETKK